MKLRDYDYFLETLTAAMSEQGPQQVKEHVQSPQDPDVEVDGRPANGNNTDTVDGHRHQEVWECSKLSLERPSLVYE